MLLIPDCIQIECPVAIFLQCNFRIGEFQIITYLYLAARSLSPAAEKLTGGVLHFRHQMQNLIIVICLCTYQTGTLSGVIVIYMHLLRYPFSIVGYIALNDGIGRHRRRTILIGIPTLEIIASTSRRRCFGQIQLFVILLIAAAATGAAVCIPCDLAIIRNPNGIKSILAALFRLVRFRIDNRAIVGCAPALKCVSVTMRIVRELELQLHIESLGFAIDLCRPLKTSCSRISSCHACARQVVIKIYNVHIAFAHFGNRRINCFDSPMSVIDNILIIRNFYCISDFITACRCIVPAFKNV